MDKIISNEFDQKFGQAYREGKTQPTNPENSFDKAQASVQSQTPNVAKTDAQQLAQSVVLNTEGFILFGFMVKDFINALFPKGVPEGSRHKTAIRLSYDLLILLDGDTEKVRALLMDLSWVKAIVEERGQQEIENILEAAQKLKHKNEGEKINDLMPSRDMQKAIEEVTGRKFSILVQEAHKEIMSHLGQEEQDNIIQLLERIGREIEKLFPYYPLLKLLCHRQKRKHYIAALLVGGAFCMNLCTRMWYRFWSAPGRHCRMNSLLALIGRMGSGKHIAVDLYKILMKPVKSSDQVQINALNAWNLEKDQNGGGAKNKKPRPNGILRALPPETSAAGAREAEVNAHEEIDGEDTYLHVSQFDSELDNTLRQLKKSYMDALFTLWLKSFHNEPHGSLLKSASAPVGEYPVHYNAVYTGTDDALLKLATVNNFVNGLLSRFTFVPMGDSNFEMMENHDYDEADIQWENDLSDWAYKLDSTKGEIPCKDISDALHKWTARRMEDAAENASKCEEDMIKRPCWHGINFALPFIVARHWDDMVQDTDGRWKCGPNFKTDKHDRTLALLIAKAQLAFQEYYFKAIGEKYYDDLLSEQTTGKHHRQKTMIGYRRLPDPFTREDVDRCFGYDGNTNNINSKVKRLVDDEMAQKINSGENKGKYRKLM